MAGASQAALHLKLPCLPQAELLHCYVINARLQQQHGSAAEELSVQPFCTDTVDVISLPALVPARC